MISGHITDKPGLHYVSVTKSIPYSGYELKPVSDCNVRVIDGEGNPRLYHNSGPGIYEVNLSSSYLSVGKTYSIIVETPGLDRQVYQSIPDTLLACPPIDSLYYEVLDRGASDLNIPFPGIRFYNDLKGSVDGAQCFRWVLYETWEFSLPEEAYAIYDGNEINDFDGSKYRTCYKTDMIKSVYTATTTYFAENRLYKNPLNFVSNQSPRLATNYNLLLQQHSLTYQSFDYWDRLRSNITESGGLFETQPSSVFGNINCTTDPEEEVLGLFYATQVQEKRIMVTEDFPFDVEHASACLLGTVSADSLDELKIDFPVYLISTYLDTTIYLYGRAWCFDCRERFGGSVIEKPDFW